MILKVAIRTTDELQAYLEEVAAEINIKSINYKANVAISGILPQLMIHRKDCNDLKHH